MRRADGRGRIGRLADVPVELRRCVVEDWLSPDEVEALRRKPGGGGDGEVVLEAFLRWNSAVQAWAADVGLNYGDRLRLVPPRAPVWAAEAG